LDTLFTSDALAFFLAQLFILVGLLGLVIPIYPGTVVIWLAMLGYGIAQGFTGLSVALFVVATLLMIGSTLVDNLLIGAGARQAGASWGTILAALAAGILGTFLLPPFGGVIAAPLVVLLLEYRRVRDWQKAWQALKGLVVGFGAAYVVRLGIGLVMMILFWVWAWRG
jgi:hypothetical protein